MKQTRGRHSTFFFRMQTHRKIAVWRRTFVATGAVFLASGIWRPLRNFYLGLLHTIFSFFSVNKVSKAFAMLFLCSFPLFHACREDLSIRDYTTPKSVEKTGNRSAGLSWKLPKGWSSKPAGVMRLASFVALSSDGSNSLDISISQLAGSGGGLFSNVNRWRSQLGLPPASPASIRADLQDSQGRMGPFKWIRLHNPARPKQGIYAALFSTKQGATLFVKMAGPPDLLKANEVAFINFCRSLKKTEVQK